MPAALIEQAARLYGAGPVAALDRPGLPAPAHAAATSMRAVSMLPAVTGNLGRPGHRIPTYRHDDRGIGRRLPRRAAPGALSRRSRSATWTWPTARGRRSARVRWSAGTSTSPASNPQQARLRRAMARDDLFTVVARPLPDRHGRPGRLSCCPPRASWSSTTWSASYFDLTLSAQVKAADRHRARRCRTRRSSAAWRPRWISTSRSCTAAIASVIDELLRQIGAASSFETAGRAWAPCRCTPNRAPVRRARVRDAERKDRDRLRARRGRRPPAPPRPLHDARPVRTAGCGCCRRRRRWALNDELRQRPEDRPPAGRSRR